MRALTLPATASKHCKHGTPAGLEDLPWAVPTFGMPERPTAERIQGTRSLGLVGVATPLIDTGRRSLGRVLLDRGQRYVGMEFWW